MSFLNVATSSSDTRFFTAALSAFIDSLEEEDIIEKYIRYLYFLFFSS